MSENILNKRQDQQYSPPKRIKKQAITLQQYLPMRSEKYKESKSSQNYDNFFQANIETEVRIPPIKQTQGFAHQEDGLGLIFPQPSFRENSLPQKEPDSKHIPTFTVSLIFWGAIVIAAVGVNNFLDTLAAILILTITYGLYLSVTILRDGTRSYIENLQQYEDYKLMYDSMVDCKAYFTFSIECYHYRTVKNFWGTNEQKIITHTATQKYYPLFCHDESSSILDVIGINKYVHIKYRKKFYFANKQSQKAFNQAYKVFIDKHKRDSHQNSHYNLEIDTFQQQIGFITTGEHKCFFFYFFCFLGLALPYACILESALSRYKINIVKKVVCK